MDEAGSFGYVNRIMKPLCCLSIFAFLLGTIIWAGFHGCWEGRYIIKNEATATHTFRIDIESRPVWSPPTPPTFEDFEGHFGQAYAAEPLPAGGTIQVHHQWDEWILGVLSIWFIGSLFFIPILLFFFRKDRLLGAIARLGVGFIGGGVLCFLLWLGMGGWGPPAPLFFILLGVIAGWIWAVIYFSAKPEKEPEGEAH